MNRIRHVDLPDALQEGVRELALRVYEDCPGQSEYRYVSRLEQLGVPADISGFIRSHYADQSALWLRNLPCFDDVQLNKILALLIGDAIGSCVAYSDYNQSYITDVRASPLSKEASAGTELLRPHSDLAFASDVCRPRHLVLVSHRSRGAKIKTLLAPAESIEAELEEDVREILRQPGYEVLSGMRLAWPYLRLDRFAILAHAGGRTQVRYDLNSRPSRELDADGAQRGAAALRRLEDVALALGREHGIAIDKGEALLISNDHCLHGREEIRSSDVDRMLLRAYVVPPEIVQRHHNRMIALSSA